MIIIGVDFHPEFQQIDLVDTDTGDFQEKRLAHREDAETFNRGLAAAGQKVRVRMEASGHARWFERLMAELQLEFVDWRRSRDSHQASTQAEDGSPRRAADPAVLLEDRFPQIWVPSWENRDLRQLLWHRHRTVQAHPDHEPVASRGPERRPALQEEVVARTRTAAT
jgi:transposase